VQQSPVHLVLDHSFPLQVVAGLDWPPYIRLSALGDVAPELIDEPDDWRVLLALGTRDDVDGYISNDAGLLDSPAELLALARTTLTLVVTTGVGNNPLRAAGLLMVYLPEVARYVGAQAPREAVIYRIAAARLGDYRRTPGQIVDGLAQRKRVPPEVLTEETLRKIQP
jgi:hypothetical protein